MYFYKPRKKVFFCCVVVWPVTTNHLFPWQVREVDSRFRRKKSKATSSLCFDTTHPRGGGYVWTRALCRPASKTGRGAHQGQRGRMDDSITVPSIPSHCPKLCFQTCREFSSELFGSVFVLGFLFFFFFFPTLRKWLQKNTDWDRWFHFTFLYFFCFLFPFNQKEIPSLNTTPALSLHLSPFMQNSKWQYLIIAIMV